jgi:predicted O-methyltransferase YrrM
MNKSMRLSLSVITGNCEKDVDRFLDVFQPHFDEVVMVRAVGNQSPDRTLEIAAGRGCSISEYVNDPRNDWPHVDNFAEARNKSAMLCNGDWIVWADMDDTAEGLENLRTLIAKLPDDVGILSVPYIVSDQGVIGNFRERAWRNNGKYSWKNALHENLVQVDGEQEKQAQSDDLRIIHIPRPDRECSKDRNLTILESIPEADRTHSHTFYLMTEYARRKDAKAVQLAQDFLAHPEGGPAERFETYLTLAAMSEDYADKAAIYTQAWTEDPSRAEPLYELTALSMSCDQPERALSYARHMMTCKFPEKPCWNHRKMFYGFFREDLYLQALRGNGHVLEADTRRGNMLATSGRPKISLLHATRGRPMQAVRTRMEWLRMADHPERVEHIFAVDMDDEAAGVFRRFMTTFCTGSGGPVEAWNAAAKACHGDVLLQLSDDWKPFRGWDTAIIEAIGDTSKPAVLAVHDGHRTDDLLCMAILTRARYIQQGNLFHPEFFSMHSDGHFSECAFSDGVVIDARESITFEHMHPAFGKSEMDETYARSNDRFHYQSGKGIWERIKNGVRVSTDVEGWCDYRGLYSHIAKVLPEGAEVVEIGSWQGQSIIHFCQRLQDIGKTAKVHCVDTFKGEQNQPEHLQIVEEHGGSILGKFTENITAAGVSEMIRVTVGDSAESALNFADGSMDFIFIDAAHDYDSVVKDLAAWWPKLKPGGIFAGHDYPWHEVEKAVDEHAAANGYTVAQVGRCWIKHP